MPLSPVFEFANLPADLIGKAAAVLDVHRQAGTRIAVAESCTGGLVAASLTEIAGSSDVFLEGFVTYANSAKARALGIDPAMIAENGAVSPEVARAMAAGARQMSGADVAVAITGVAGPGGGSADKPVGHVVFARDSVGFGSGTVTVRFQSGDRSAIRRAAAAYALGLLDPSAPLPEAAVVVLPAP
jgi:nicotinamide-nucleotide amidase